MLTLLQNPTYRRLLLSQVVALIGTGLATVALGLLAYELAGSSAALVLGTALTVKMVAYVTIAPLATAYLGRFNRRNVLVALNFVRAILAGCLPFVSEIWHVYVVIFVLQAASAGYTPTFQATIPDVVIDEKEYTKALSLSRLAMDLENIFSPAIAALVLVFISFDYLFWGTSIGFISCALLLISLTLPAPATEERRPVHDRLLRGLSIYLKTPRLRGLLALSWVASSTGAMVIVNSVVVIRRDLSMSESSVGIALTTFGAGSMLTAIILPRVLGRFDDRFVMLTGAYISIVSLMAMSIYVLIVELTFYLVLLGWFAMAIGYSAILTPSGRLLAKSAHPEDRPTLFAAQFALSHACWLAAYPLAGALITFGGVLEAMVGLFAFALVGLIAATYAWPPIEVGEVEHTHPELPLDHPHLNGKKVHKHKIVIDDLHPSYLGIVGKN